MKIKTLIIDDEPLGREVIEAYIGKIEFLELIASCEDAFDAMSYLESTRIDIVISDIQMPKVNGIELLKSLKSPPLIIFVTAHSSFAIEGYEMGVIDYLLKPVSFDRFLKAINKAKEALVTPVDRNEMKDDIHPNYIFLKIDNKFCKLPLEEILYIESAKDYQKIHILGGKPLLVYSTLKLIEERLPSPPFLRIHHSYLINTSHINFIQGNTIELANNKVLNIALSKKDQLLKLLKIE